jgi:phosphoglucomutase
VVSSSLIDRVAKRLERHLYEVPVGFKWFADGLLDGALGFGGEESAGASLLRHDGSVWTTDKDGIVPALLSAEMTARLGKDPGELYRDLTDALGKPVSDRIDAPANAQQKAKLSKLSPTLLEGKLIAGEKIDQVFDRAPGNNAAIGGIKAIAASGWFAARPSGTESIYKIYAESFKDETHLKALLKEAQTIVDAALAGS